MAKSVKSGKSDFRSIFSDIRQRNFSPVYLLMGEEAYYIDRIVDALERSVVAEDERDFNFTVVYGQDADMPSVIASCQQYPFMADRRIVILKEAQSMTNAKNALEALAPYVERPNLQCVLVVSHKGGDLNATSKLMKAASKSGNAVVFKSPALREWEVAAPVSEYCREKKVGIGDDCIEILKEYIGYDLSKLFGAIDKLAVSVEKDNGRITRELIERNIGISKDFNNFELQSALAAKNYDRCMRIISYFESNPRKNPTNMTTGMLFGFYSKLLAAQLSADKSPAGLKAAVGAKSDFAFRDYRTALSKYSPLQTLNAIHMLRDFDTRSKGVDSFQNEYDLLKELIYNIFTGLPANARIPIPDNGK